MTTIRLHGELGERFGPEYRLAVISFAEALHAINVKNKSQVYPWLFERDKKGVKYQVVINGEDFQSDVPLDQFNEESVKSVLVSDLTIKKKLETIDIVPVVEGADSDAFGIATLVLGILLIATGIGAGAGGTLLGINSSTFILVGVALAAGGIINLLSQPPEFQDFREISNSGKTSYLFSGPQNTIGEGGPVPIGYGRLIVGSQTISASYRIKNIDAGAVEGPEDALNILINQDSYNLASRTDISVAGPVNAISFSDDGLLRYSASFGGAQNPLNPRSNAPGVTIYTLKENLENVNLTTTPLQYFDVRDISNDGLIAVGGSSMTVAKPTVGGRFNNITYNSLYLAYNLVFGNNNAGFTGGGKIANCILKTAANNYLIGGDFTTFTSIESTPSQSTTNNIAKIVTDGYSATLAGGFSCSVTSGAIYCMALQSDNKILIGGDFTTVGSDSRNKIARLNSDGTIDLTFNAGDTGTGIVYSIKVLSNGKILIGGTFSKVQGDTNYAYFARLTSTGGLDAYIGGFSTDNTDSIQVRALAVQSLDNKIIIAGYFTGIGSVGKNSIARFNSDLTIDSTFDAGTLFQNTKILVAKVRDDFTQSAANGKIYIGTSTIVIDPRGRMEHPYGSLLILNNEGYLG